MFYLHTIILFVAISFCVRGQPPGICPWVAGDCLSHSPSSSTAYTVGSEPDVYKEAINRSIKVHTHTHMHNDSHNSHVPDLHPTNSLHAPPTAPPTTPRSSILPLHTRPLPPTTYTDLPMNTIKDHWQTVPIYKTQKSSCSLHIKQSKDTLQMHHNIMPAGS